MSADEVTISVKTEPDGVTCIQFQDDDIDLASVPTLERELRRLIDEREKPDVVLDFSKVRFMASMGIGAIIGLHVRVKTRGGRLRLVGLNDDLRAVLELVRVNEILEIED